ncbi:uncharacterized protein J4E79_011592 [Alternaria viburni]|uniref:uncharacterized protein n=1 Tax=Alternaria viburni TaxID=566460 RepID=UPI0020C2935B|nr:uncharacterized protein J4E79_011592 [Alternaria viburni]KAI4642066.1 hypothetical protein J4E79_011592 [Alternaria viburni]
MQVIKIVFKAPKTPSKCKKKNADSLKKKVLALEAKVKGLVNLLFLIKSKPSKATKDSF